MLSMTFGFDRTMLIGLVLYAVATAVMVTAREPVVYARSTALGTTSLTPV
jgi:hypothetical protein